MAAHGAAQHIIGIEHLHAAAAENFVFGMGIIEQIIVAVEVVFRNIQHRGRIGIQMMRVFQLKTGKLEHPHIGRPAFALHIGLQHRRANIAGHHRVEPALRAQITRQARDRGFAVAAADGDDFVALLGQQAGQNFNVAKHTAAVLLESFDFRLPLADAGADGQNIKAVLQRIFQTALITRQTVKLLLQLHFALCAQIGIISRHIGALLL